MQQLSDLIEELKPKPPIVHGLKKLEGRDIKRSLPFQIQLTPEQGVFTCLCNKGWLAVTTDPQEAFQIHLKG